MEPTTNKSLLEFKFQKIYASTHSSAAIDINGKLLTWGSVENNRLMHTVISEKKRFLKLNMLPVDQFISIPKIVTAECLQNAVVSSFCFSKYSSAVLVSSMAYRVRTHILHNDINFN